MILEVLENLAELMKIMRDVSHSSKISQEDIQLIIDSDRRVIDDLVKITGEQREEIRRLKQQQQMEAEA